MKVLITGATGLIGSEIVSLLLSKGYVIHYLTTSKQKISQSENYIGFYWDPQQGYIDENCLYGVDVIMHLAGATVSKRWSATYKQEIIESRILPTQLLFRLLKNHENQVKRFISASAIGLYPSDFNHLYTEEDMMQSNDFLGTVVNSWEENADVFQQLKIEVCKIRIGLVLSRNGGALQEMMKPAKLGLASAFGSGLQWQSWIHIKDLAAIFVFAFEKELSGVFNAVSPKPVSNDHLMRSISKQLKKPYFFPNVPKFIMKLVLGEMHELLFASQKVSAQKIISQGFVFEYPTLDIALKDLIQ